MRYELSTLAAQRARFVDLAAIQGVTRADLFRFRLRDQAKLGARVILAKDAGRIAGFICYLPGAQVPGLTRNPEIVAAIEAAGVPIEAISVFSNLYVDLAYTGRGIGSRLDAEYSAAAIAEGATHALCFYHDTPEIKTWLRRRAGRVDLGVNDLWGDPAYLLPLIAP